MSVIFSVGRLVRLGDWHGSFEIEFTAPTGKV